MSFANASTCGMGRVAEKNLQQEYPPSTLTLHCTAVQCTARAERQKMPDGAIHQAQTGYLDVSTMMYDDDDVR
jgi:hypothetical protein